MSDENIKFLEARLYKYLKENFGLNEFRDGQKEALLEIMQGRSYIHIQKTGSGKSLIFEMASLVLDGVVIVLVPLNALIANHAASAAAKRIPFFSYNSDSEPTQLKGIQAQLAAREHLVEKLFLITPERMLSADFRTTVLDPLYEQNQIALFVFDEIHVASGWGKDFRPNCRNADFRTAYARVPCLMLTASATEATIRDVQQQFGMKEATVFRGYVNRANIDYTVIGTLQLTGSKERHIVQYLLSTYKQPVCGIVYVLRVDDTVEIADMLNEELGNAGWKVAAYNAKLPTEQKTQVREEWLAGRIHIVASTTALGMGIDKRDVHFVIHHAHPRTLEEFYQESSRAGRGPEIQAHSLCFFDSGLSKFFIKRWKEEIEEQVITPATFEEKKAKLRAMEEFCKTDGCRRALLVKYFRPTEVVQCNKTCDNCRAGKKSAQMDLRDFMVQRKRNLPPTDVQVDGVSYFAPQKKK